MISEPTPERKNSVVSKATTVPGKVKKPCFNFEKGTCANGNQCRFLHTGEVRVPPTKRLTAVIFKKDSASLGTSASSNTLQRPESLKCASFSPSAARVQKERGVILSMCSCEGEVPPPNHHEEIN